MGLRSVDEAGALGGLQVCGGQWKSAGSPGPLGIAGGAHPSPQEFGGRRAPPKRPLDSAFEMPEPAEPRMKDRLRGCAFTAFGGRAAAAGKGLIHRMGAWGWRAGAGGILRRPPTARQSPSL